MAFEIEDELIDALILRINDRLAPLLGGRQQTRSVQLGAEPLYEECDAERLLQVLINLLGNAIKFSPVGTSIELGVCAWGGKVCLGCKSRWPIPVSVCRMARSIPYSTNSPRAR